MFAYNDKLRLAVINVKDKTGNILPINISLPSNVKNICLPETVLQLTIFEYHEGIEVYGHHAFNVYVGQTATFEEMLNNKVKIKINSKFNPEIKSSQEQLVYTEREDGVFEIYGSVQGNDIVVNSVEELEEILKRISKELSSIQRSVANIRKLSKNKKK